MVMRVSVKKRLTNLKTKLKPRLSRITSKFESKITRALSTPESRKQRAKRIKRIRNIFLFAATSFAIGSAIYYYPPARNLLVSSSVQLKSKASELFSSADLETDPSSAPLSLESSSDPKTMINRLLIAFATIGTLILLKQVGPSILASFDGPVEVAEVAKESVAEVAKESTVKSIADTRADDSTCGIGPEDWPSWARILLYISLQVGSMVLMAKPSKP